MPIPTLLIRGIAVLWLALGVSVAFHAAALSLWTGAGVVLGSLACADLWLAHRRGCPIVAYREFAVAWPVGVGQTVALYLQRTDPARVLRGIYFDHVPGPFVADGLTGRFNLARGAQRIEYRAFATARGEQWFGPLEVLLDSPLFLWRWRYRLLEDIGPTHRVRVYPDFARIARYALLATDHRLAQIGLLLRRRRGEGMEFHQLREYREGDALRQIDWKASARQRKLISREYQDERNQQIMFLLDCGQRMHTREREPEAAGSAHRTGGAANLSHFDHVLNAMLLLCYVALHQGDGVGLSTFAHPLARHFNPRCSLATLNMLMETVYDLEPTALTPDYLAAALDLMRQTRKRSLVVLLTNLRDEDDDTLVPALSMLARRHLVLVASLREPGLTATREHPVASFDDALAYAAASEYQYARQRSVARLRARGIETLEVTPAQLPIALVNRYWRIKRSGQL